MTPCKCQQFLKASNNARKWLSLQFERAFYFLFLISFVSWQSTIFAIITNRKTTKLRLIKWNYDYALSTYVWKRVKVSEWYDLWLSLIDSCCSKQFSRSDWQHERTPFDTLSFVIISVEVGIPYAVCGVVSPPLHSFKHDLYRKIHCMYRCIYSKTQSHRLLCHVLWMSAFPIPLNVYIESPRIPNTRYIRCWVEIVNQCDRKRCGMIEQEVKPGFTIFLGVFCSVSRWYSPLV